MGEQEFRKAFKGILVKKGDAGYDEQVTPVYNVWRDVRPLWWARIKDEDGIFIYTLFVGLFVVFTSRKTLYYA